MDTLTRLISDNNALVTLALLSAVLVLAIMVTVLMRRLNSVTKKWADLMRGQSGEGLDGILNEHLVERRRLETAVAALETRANVSEKKMASTIRYIGVVRYDAFADVGGTQSWSMAFYDETGNGAVISCLYGRTDCRVYSKVLEGGKADRSLTGEEQAAIEAAARGGRSVVRA